MLSFFKKIYHKEMFNPSFLALFFNPFYIIRRNLFKNIKINSNILHGKVLDFGCGRKPYKNLFNVSEYIGLDIEESGHDHKNEDIDVFYNGNKIPFEDEYFDCIFSSESFQCVFEMETILKELKRVCKSKGYIFVTAPFIWDENEVPYHFANYSSFGLKYLLEKHDFKVVKAIKTGTYIETLFQMLNNYIYLVLRYKLIQLMFSPLFMVLSIIGIVLSKIFPNINSFYLNNIIIARKI
jgi:ubiquinone/menaquinone biosynthesis C-methylase UbiE